jgi:hypothetical protein
MKKRILVLVTAVALMVVTSVAPASAKNNAWLCVNPTSPGDRVLVKNQKKMENLVALGWQCTELPPREKVDKPPKPEPI